MGLPNGASAHSRATHVLKVPTHTIQGVLATIGVAYILGS